MSGTELLHSLITHHLSMPVIVLTAFADVPTAIAMFQAGIFDFIEKPFQNNRLLDTVQAALRRDSELRSLRSRRSEVETRLARLTSGERDVLDGMLTGKPYKKIASDLNISYKTVQARRAQIMKKMESEELAGLMNLIYGTQMPSESVSTKIVN